VPTWSPIIWETEFADTSLVSLPAPVSPVLTVVRHGSGECGKPQSEIPGTGVSNAPVGLAKKLAILITEILAKETKTHRLCDTRLGPFGARKKSVANSSARG